MPRKRQLARWLFGTLRFVFAFAPWLVVVGYFGTCLWATWVLARHPRYGELDGTLWLELMRLVNFVLLVSVPTVAVYPFVRRAGDWSLDLAAIGGVLTVIAVLVFALGGYLVWYRD